MQRLQPKPKDMTVYSEPVKLNRNHLLAITTFLILNVVLLFVFRDVSVGHTILFLALFLVWCSPGYLFAIVANKGHRKGPFFWIVALAAGYHLSSLLTVLTVHAFSIPTWVVVLFIAGFALSAFLILHNRLRFQVTQFQLPRRGINLLPLGILLAFILLFLFLVLQPYSQAGKSSASGLHFNDLFSTVFFKHMSITSELTRQEIPPENPFFRGEKLNYYWLFHVFPSVVHTSLNIPLEETLFLLTWFVSIITLFAILILIHAFSTRTSDLILGVTPLLFAYSYDGAFVLANLREQSKPLSDFSSMNIDAAARTYLQSPTVIGIYRAFVFDPHHMFAICLMVLAFLLFRRALHFHSKIVAGSALFLLGGIAGHSAFIAYTAIAWIGLWLLVEIFRGQASIIKDLKFLGFAMLVFLSYAFFYFGFPGFFEIGKSDLSISIVSRSMLFVVIDFGAPLVLGLLGLILGIKKKDWRVLPLAILLLVSFSQLFFTYFPDWPDDISMKVGHSIYIALACLTAHFFSKQAVGSSRRRLATVAFAVICFPAVPTLIMDWYSLQQTSNLRTTTVVTHDDLEACEWINNSLPRDAVVQSFPIKEGIAFYSLIPTFAQRRTALGDPMHARIFQGDSERTTNRNNLIRLMFHTSSSDLSWLIARNLEIGYIYFGSTERKLFSERQSKFRDPQFFSRVYAKGKVRIFQVLPDSNISEKYPDSYDEKSDTNAVLAGLENGFVKMKSQDIWHSLRWEGESGAILALNSRNQFNGVLLFRIFVPESMRLELQSNQFSELIDLEPGWRWIELKDILLEKGINKLSFNLGKGQTKVFQISDVTYFGRQLNTNLSTVLPFKISSIH
jgi:hypothetical protein